MRDLQTELNNRSLTTHNHDERYSQLGHSHSLTIGNITDLNTQATLNSLTSNKNIIMNSGHIEFTRNSNQPMGNGRFPTKFSIN